MIRDTDTGAIGSTDTGGTWLGAGGQSVINDVVVSGSSSNLSESQKLAGSSNYQTWRFVMKGMLVTDGMCKCVTGEEHDSEKCDSFLQDCVEHSVKVSSYYHELYLSEATVGLPRRSIWGQKSVR